MICTDKHPSRTASTNSFDLIVTGLSPSTRARFPVSPFNLTVAAVLLAFGQMTVATTVFNPPADRFTCTFAVTRIDALVERPGKHLLGPMLYGQNEAILAFCGSVSGTYIFRSTHARALSRSMAFTCRISLRQLHALRNRLTINHRGTTAYSPDPASVFVRCEAVSSFSLRN